MKRQSLLRALRYAVIIYLHPTHLIRSFGRAYRARFFGNIIDGVRRVRQDLEKGAVRTVASRGTAIDAEESRQRDLSTFYVLDWASAFFSEKLQGVAKRRAPDLYLVACWLWTVLVTCAVYSLEYLALFKLDAESFSNAGHGGYWQFLGLSFGMLMPAGLSKVEPSSTTAILLCYSEIACALAIFVILLFVILTAARERYQEELSEFVKELRSTGVAVRGHVERVYSMAFDQVEIIVLVRHKTMVNSLRKLRGLPELTPPADDGETEP